MTRCNTFCHSEEGMPYASFRGPGRRCFSITGGLTFLSSARRCWSFWYSLLVGIWKRYKIGDSVLDARRFRSTIYSFYSIIRTFVVSLRSLLIALALLLSLR